LLPLAPVWLSNPLGIGPLARWIEGCKRQATDLLARDFYSLSLPTPDCVGPSVDENGWLSSVDAEKLFLLPYRSSEKMRPVRNSV